MTSPTAQGVLELVDTVVRCSGALSRLGDEVAARHGQTAARSLILGALADEVGSIADIARRRGLRRQSVQQTMQRLESDGLVARVPGTSRRSPVFRLTPAGRRLQQALHADFAAWAERAAGLLTDCRPEQALRVLAALMVTAAGETDAAPQDEDADRP